jgi:hypothetical protein
MEAKEMGSERLGPQRQRRQAWSAVRAAVGVRGEDTPSEPESFGGMTKRMMLERRGRWLQLPILHVSKDLPSLGNIFSQQVRISIGVHRPKLPSIEIRPPIGPPPHPTSH